jgi:hypothetical protein
LAHLFPPISRRSNRKKYRIMRRRWWYKREGPAVTTVLDETRRVLQRGPDHLALPLVV